MGKAGLPDLLAIRGGRAYWIEVKQPGGKPTRLQEHRLDELRGAGCGAGVAASVDDAARICAPVGP